MFRERHIETLRAFGVGPDVLGGAQVDGDLHGAQRCHAGGIAFAGKHFQLNDARNNPKPLRRRLPIWIGGRGEKRTLRAAARWADGWNGPYIGPEEWKRKNAVLDDWCAKEGRDPREITRTVNVGFYLGADARGAARGEAVYQSHFGHDARTGFLRGTPARAAELIAAYREAGVQRLNIGLRQGPYDWDALRAFAEEVVG